jgi:hypothetical protein
MQFDLWINLPISLQNAHPFIALWETWKSLISTLKSYLLSASCFWLGRWFDWSRWVVMGVVGKKSTQPTKIGFYSEFIYLDY